MRVAFIVNDETEIGPRQTTAMLIAEATRRDHRPLVCGVEGLHWGADDRPALIGRRVEGRHAGTDSLLSALASAEPEALLSSDLDLVMFRTNPARDPERVAAHRAALGYAFLLEEAGVRVVNSAAGLARSATKLYMQSMPAQVRPETMIGSDRRTVRAFVAARPGPVVLKPLQGTRGTDVMLVDPSGAEVPPELTVSLDTAIERLLPGGAMIVQDYVSEAAAGDMRVIVLDGALLEIDGLAAAVRRVPPEGDFRSNVFVGGTVAPGFADERVRRIVGLVGPKLKHDGIFLAGLDVIGDRIVEVNTYSTGGLFDAERISGRDFVGAVWDALEST